MPRLNQVDPATAQGKSKGLLDAVQENLGAVPNLLRVMANEPAALETFLANKTALESGSFDAATREAIALTVAGFNGCSYCASAHIYIAKAANVDEAEALLNLKGISSEARTQTILTFVNRVLETRGKVTDQDLQTARAGGLDDGAIAEVIANVSANVFTNYLNNVAQTDIDFPFVDIVANKAA